MSKEVTIVGAGPSGLTAAVTLAKAGVSVTVYERGPSVGTRFHGDFQGLENWSRQTDVLQELQGLGIEINFQAQPRHAVDFYDTRGKRHHISMQEPFYYLVRRGNVKGSLDLGLFDQAQKAGVNFQFNTKLDRIDGPAIVATGPRYADGICVGYLFETDLEDLSACVLSQSLAPRGYSYLLICDGRGTIVSCHFANLQQWRTHLNATVEKFQQLYGFELRNAKFFAGYGNVFAKKRFREGQKIYVGEAAGLQDGLWGFGMGFAIRSGYLAAQSILHGHDFEQLIRRELLPYHRAGLVNRFLWDLLDDRCFAFFLDRAERWTDARQSLRKLSGPHPAKNAIYPFVKASRGWQARYRDESCWQGDCTCVWCACLREIENRQSLGE